MLAENLIDLKQAELMIDWCAAVIDSGSLATTESSMAKVSVSEGLMRVADRSVQVMGGSGLTSDTIVEQVFREIRAFRIYDALPKCTNGRSPRRSNAMGDGTAMNIRPMRLM